MKPPTFCPWFPVKPPTFCPLVPGETAHPLQVVKEQVVKEQVVVMTTTVDKPPDQKTKPRIAYAERLPFGPSTNEEAILWKQSEN